MTTNPVTGETEIVGHDGKVVKLRPDFAAALAIEDALGQGVDMLRTRAIVGGVAGEGIDPKLTLTTRELGILVHAGMRAAGDHSKSADAATEWAWQTGRRVLRQPIVDFLWALANGGRGREDDLKNVVSSLGSQPGPNGASAKDDPTEDIIRQLEDAPNSESSSASR